MTYPAQERRTRRRASAVHAAVQAACAHIDAHIDAHCAEPLRVADLAAAAGVSECHFIRQFRQHVGIPPHAYLTRRRLERAAELLAEDVAPCEVAHLTGFADQAHFTRRFRRAYGMPPGEYQRRARTSRAMRAAG